MLGDHQLCGCHWIADRRVSGQAAWLAPKEMEKFGIDLIRLDDALASPLWFVKRVTNGMSCRHSWVPATWGRVGGEPRGRGRHPLTGTDQRRCSWLARAGERREAVWV